jgi:Ca-activated chloride channel family protein
MRIMPAIVILFFSCAYFQSRAQQVEKTIQKGNDFYRKQKYQEAEEEYRKITENDSSYTIARFNLANTLYRLGKKEEALSIFDKLAADTKENTLLPNHYYNKGVIFTSQQRLEESIAAYKNGLIRDPGDKEARENLQKALLELKKKNPPKENPDKKRKEQKQKQQPQMNQKEAEQKLRQLEQKEKELQQRVQKERSTGGGSRPKDW